MVMSLDILRSDVACSTKPRHIAAPVVEDFQLRLILWYTVGVRRPGSNDKYVNQQIRVTANFDGDPGNEVYKETDIAWSTAAEDRADWNWRMLFNVKLPCANPRLKIQVWGINSSQVGEGTACAEINYNLNPLFARMLQERATKVYFSSFSFSSSGWARYFGTLWKYSIDVKKNVGN
eukprot:jgi/Bigna1/67725/fgenesh1_pg.4_\